MAKEKKRKLPRHLSPMKSRCEELAEKISAVSHDKTSVEKALTTLYSEGFDEGYQRKGLDISFQKKAHDEIVKKDWLEQRGKIIFERKNKA